MPGAAHDPTTRWRYPDIMRALEPSVVDAVWATVEPLLPPPDRSHPLGCHRPRVPDRVCFRGILIRLVIGASWVDIEAILDHQVSDTTLRSRRDESIDAGVFEALKSEAIAAFDRIIGLDRSASRRITPRRSRRARHATRNAKARSSGRSASYARRSCPRSKLTGSRPTSASSIAAPNVGSPSGCMGWRRAPLVNDPTRA